MTEGFHMGTTQVFEIATLPISWKYSNGLKYPLHICRENGEHIEFETYAEHHEFISKLFHPTKYVRKY